MADDQGGVAGCLFHTPAMGPDRNRGLFQHDETQMAVRETTPDMSQVTFKYSQSILKHAEQAGI